MSDQPTGALPPGALEPLPWYQVWIKALTRPSEDTFSELLAQDPNPSMGKAFWWIILSSLIGGLIVLIFSLVFNLIPFGLFSNEDLAGLWGGSLIGLICIIPFSLLAAVIGFAIYSGILQLVARVLGGEGTYDQLTYAFAAYGAPLGLISSLISPIPFVGFCLGPLLGIYGFILNVMAVKAVHRFDWGRAILTSLSILIIFSLVACCVAVLIAVGLAALFPTVRDTFPEFYRVFQTALLF